MAHLTIPRSFSEKLHSKGFLQKGALFYRIENDIAFCIAFERTGMLYCRFFILPLYLPCDGIHYTYGDRLEHYPLLRRFSPLPLAEDDRAHAAWFARLEKILDAKILPFFTQIHTPQCLYQTLTKRKAVARRHFFCPPERLALLEAYTAFYLHLPAGNHITDSKAFVMAAKLSDAQKVSLNNELDELLALEAYDDPTRAQWIAQTVAQAKLRCKFP